MKGRDPLVSAKVCACCGSGMHISNPPVRGVVVCSVCRPTLKAELQASPLANSKGVARKMLRRNTKTQSFILRDIPADVVGDLKIRSVARGISMRDAIIHSIKRMLYGD